MKTLLYILGFEILFWKRKPSVYVKFFLIFLISLLLFTLKDLRLGQSNEMIYKNSPYILTNIYIFLTLFTPVILNEYISFSISRDFEYKFHELIYTYPVKKYILYLSRFLGAICVILFIFISVPLADILAPLMPWKEDGSLLPFQPVRHLWCLVFVFLPNVLIIGWILFYFTSLLKNIRYAVLISIGLIALYLTYLQLFPELPDKLIISITDPFGFIPILDELEKQTAFEKNNFFIPITYRYTLNRIIWLGIGFSLFWTSYSRRSKKIPASAPRKETKTEAMHSSSYSREIIFTQAKGLPFAIHTIYEEAKSGLVFIMRSNIMLTMAGTFFLMIFMRWIGTIQSDDATRYYTTYHTLNNIFSIAFIFKIFIIFIIGELYWREKNYYFEEIKYALPCSSSHVFLGKIVSVAGLYAIFGILILLSGTVIQLFQGHAPIEFHQYLFRIYVLEFDDVLFISILSFCLHVLTSQKFLAMGLTALIIIFQNTILYAFHVESNMVGILPKFPELIYSDFYGYGPYLKPYFAFLIYWLLIYSVILFLTLCLFPGYKNISFQEKIKLFKTRFSKNRKIFIIISATTLLFSSFMFYQTQIKNPYLSYKDTLKWKAYYEKEYKKKYSHMPQPKVVHADYTIHLYGKENKYMVIGKLWLKNKSRDTIRELYINNPSSNPFKIQTTEIYLYKSDSSKYIRFEIYRLKNPLLPGDSIQIEYTFQEIHQGIENEVFNQRLLPNGTFLDNSQFTPEFGYIESLEIDENNKRKEYGLPIKQYLFPPLEKNCTENCMWNYVTQSDWATVRSIISTYEDEIAIAPGKLFRQWKENGRAFFEYRLVQPSMFFFSVVSGKFQLKKEKLDSIDLEVYYHPSHHWNAEQILRALRSSMEYYTRHFGPYYHPQARIIEFPQFSSFAQAFPGTMPYSESIGFTANYSDNTEDINRIFHVVAHEMAHQWWAHQVVGARMQGAPLLSESLAEFSSSLVLEKNFGQDMLMKFLRQSNNNYILGRSSESKREPSLLTTDVQSYVYYNKAAVVLNSIRYLLGIKTILNVMHEMIKDFAYKNPPYPTSLHFAEKLYTHTPDSLKNAIKDRMENIVIWDVNVRKKEMKKNSDSSWIISLQLELFKYYTNPNVTIKEDIRNTELGKAIRQKADGMLTIALFKDDHSEKIYGTQLQSQNVRVNENILSVQMNSREKPDKIVIDPLYINIWKDSEKKVVKL